MRYFYDTEFVDNGTTVELISIGIVAEDGREYYAVNKSAPWERVRRNRWLMDNVVPTLPRGHLQRKDSPQRWLVDFEDPIVKPRAHIAAEVLQFVNPDTHGQVELWAWYGAYDHVVLAQMFGPMVNFPAAFPMWTNDLRQEQRRLGDPVLPEQPDGAHNALADARHNLVRFKHLLELAQPQHLLGVAR